ncbi:MAG: AmmeMemoRadiSam system protein B, partial [Candidatus Krumholzibacteria bacterium]|nr:AmmeMemoRadiSam system protein B [Candidatus Krumholzibacteria bacterium]
MSDSSCIRKPAVAGSFYPSDPVKLRTDLRAMLDDVGELPAMGRPLVLVEPHAGYVYSGRVAAHGYSLLENLNIDTVVVVSPSHAEHFPFVSVFDGDAYETPLGRIPVDKPTARDIVSADPILRLSGNGHIQNGEASREHALEVQLPFLQTVLDEFCIVPIVMGDQSWETCQALGNALGPILKRDNVITVISSDLSHFYPHNVAAEMDGV